MMVESGSFYMTLASNASVREFPDNTASAFKVQLPEPVRFGLTEWEVALTNFIYPQTIRQKSNVYKFQVYVPGERLQTVELSDQRFQTVGDFLKGIASMVTKWFASKGISNGNRLIDIRDEDGGDYTRIKINGGARLGFHRDAARLVGFLRRDDTIDPNYRKPNHRVDEARPKGSFVFISSRRRGGSYSENSILLHLPNKRPISYSKSGIQTLYIYTNIIEPHPVGDTQTRLLRQIVLAGDPGDIVTDNFKNAFYYKLGVHNFQTVEILITGDTGQRLPFASGTVQATLHFRRLSAEP